MVAFWSHFAQSLRSTAAGLGASLLGYEDQDDSLVAGNVNDALDELSLPLNLVAGAEVTNVIPVVVTGPAHVAQYKASVYDADMLHGLVGAWTLAETGAGAEVSTTAKPTLLFTTDANGAATISVTDVAGASGLSVYLEVAPVSVPAGAKAGSPSIVSITFD